MRTSKTLLAALLVIVAALPVCAKKERKAEGAVKAGPTGGMQAANPNEPVAYIGDEPITQAEVDKLAASQLAKLRQQEYETRRMALEKILSDKLFEREASKRKVTVEALLETEVDKKAGAPSKEEVSLFYEQNKARMGGQTLEQVSPNITQYLQQQRTANRRRDFFNEMMDKANASILLDPPRVDVGTRADDMAKGPDNAPVTIVEFSDFQCPFCKRAHAIVEQLLAQYGDKIRLVYRDYPLQFHPQAIPASEAARCAGEQGKYWEYHSNLMTIEGSLMEDDLKRRAADVGLDAESFQACLESNRHEEAIKHSFEEGSELGVTGTPTFFINGRMIVGAKPIEELQVMIDEEIDRFQRRKGKSQIGG